MSTGDAADHDRIVWHENSLSRGGLVCTKHQKPARARRVRRSREGDSYIRFLFLPITSPVRSPVTPQRSSGHSCCEAELPDSFPGSRLGTHEPEALLRSGTSDAFFALNANRHGPKRSFGYSRCEAELRSESGIGATLVMSVSMFMCCTESVFNPARSTTSCPKA